MKRNGPNNFGKLEGIFFAEISPNNFQRVIQFKNSTQNQNVIQKQGCIFYPGL